MSDTDSIIHVGDKDEVVMTKDSVINFAQMAVLTCQRAQGDQNKVMRESWVRLCGTYQGKVGILATPEVRKVRLWTHQSIGCMLIVVILTESQRYCYIILRYAAAPRSE